METTTDVFGNPIATVANSGGKVDAFGNEVEATVAKTDAFGNSLDQSPPAGNPLTASPAPSLSGVATTPQAVLPFAESTHPGDVAFKQKLAQEALKRESESLPHGIPQAFVAGMEGSGVGRKIAQVVAPMASEDFQRNVDLAEVYYPRGVAEKVAQGAGQFFSGAPLMVAGGAVLGTAGKAIGLTGKALGLTEAMGAGAALGAGSAAMTETKEGEKAPSVLGEAVKGAVTMGPTAFVPGAQSVLGAILKKAPSMAAVMAGSTALYDHFIRGKPLDLTETIKQTGEEIPTFMLLEAIGSLGRMPMMPQSKTAEPTSQPRTVETTQQQASPDNVTTRPDSGVEVIPTEGVKNANAIEGTAGVPLGEQPQGGEGVRVENTQGQETTKAGKPLGATATEVPSEVVPLSETLSGVKKGEMGGGKIDLTKPVKEVVEKVNNAVDGLVGLGNKLKDSFTANPIVTSIKKAIGWHQTSMTSADRDIYKFAKQHRDIAPSKDVSVALHNYIDAGGDTAQLADSVKRASDANRKGYEDALKLTDQQKVFADKVVQYYKERGADLEKRGMTVKALEHYINRVIDTSGWASKQADALRNRTLADLQSHSKFGSDPAWLKKRLYEFNIDAENAGLTIKKDAFKQMADYEHSYQKAIADEKFITDAMKMKAADGRPVIAERGAEDTLGYVPIDAVGLRGKQLVAHPQEASQINAFLGKSTVSIPVRNALKVSSAIKQTMLDLSIFHPVQIGIHALEHRVNLPKALKRWSLDLNEKSHEGDLMREASRGGLTLGEGGGAQLMMEGSGAGASLINKILKNAPSKYARKVGDMMQDYNHWVFNDYIPKIKMEMFSHALERNLKRYPEWTRDQVVQHTAEEANNAFGGQNWAMLGKSKTFQDHMRLAFLAPDFLISRMKFVGQGLQKGGEGKLKGDILNDNEQRQALVLGALTMYITARIANHVISGEWRNEPENAFSIIKDGRAYSLRTVQGDLIHLGTEPMKFMMNRLNPLIGRTGLEAATGRDYFGRKRNVGEQIKDLATSIVPISLRGLPGLGGTEQSLGESLKAGAGLMNKRASSSREIYELANKYKDTHGIANQEIIYDRDKDPYYKLRSALTMNDKKAAKEAYRELVDSKAKNRLQIVDHFKQFPNSPFTGSRGNDMKFFRTLTDDQQKVYKDAIDERKAVRTRFFQYARG